VTGERTVVVVSDQPAPGIDLTVSPVPGPPSPPETGPGTDPPRERTPISAAVSVSLGSVAALGALAVFLVAYALGFSALQEQRSQHQLYASFRGLLDPSSPIAAYVGGVIPPGSPVAVITAPAAGLHNVMVVEGTSSGDLLKGPGHLRDSPLPGQAGQSLVLGKSVTAGGPFRHVTDLHSGDQITVTTGQAVLQYTVEDLRSGGDTLPAIPAGGSVLTLVTSTGSGWLRHLAPSHVVYVDAVLKGSTAPTPPGRPVAVPTAELPGHNDPGAWPYLVLWLQGLIIAAVGGVWSWMRWGRWQTWLVAIPILLGVLWGISEETMRLLPNVL
jgi:sortase A